MTPLPEYALAPVVFPLRSLATLAGRAPLGGGREAALGCFVVARLALGAAAGAVPALSADARAARAVAARGWLAAQALPAPLRVPLARLADATAGDRAALPAAVRAVAAAAAPWLDAPSQSELESLARALEPAQTTATSAA